MQLREVPESLDSDSARSLLAPSVEQIRQAQTRDGAIHWTVDATRLDLWNMLEATMALASWGDLDAVRGALDWAVQHQRPDGGWWAEYRLGEVRAASAWSVVHHAAYLATAVRHAAACGLDPEPYQSAVSRGIEFALAHQNPDGTVAWARAADGSVHGSALRTACSSICLSLADAAALYGHAPDAAEWLSARARIGEAIRSEADSFDQDWPDKSNHAMDWFYPVLAGLGTPEWGAERIDARWDEFIEPNLGCRCVTDEPWVTVAETCELVMALLNLGRPDAARRLFLDVMQLRDVRGRLWMGCQFDLGVWWPREQPSWSSAAAVLAGDALFGWSPAGAIWTQR